jgi:Tfp pilus assembly protein PilO
MRAVGSRLFHRNQQIWVCVVAGLFLCDFVLCGYLPSQRRLEALRKARARQSQTIQMAAAQGAELPALRRRLQTVQETVERYDACVPAERALGTFLQQIASIMTQHRLTDQVVVPGNEVSADGLSCIPVQITCRGNLADMFLFFNGLQALDRLVRFERVVLQNDDEFSGRARMQTDAVIFYELAGQEEANRSAGAKPAEGVNHGA